jgi:hypothetical protein
VTARPVRHTGPGGGRGGRAERVPVLARAGRDVSVVPRAPTAPRTPDEFLAHLLREVPRGRDVVLVPHSNAGLYVPAVSAVRDVVAAVLVDAALPPAGGPAPVAPPELLGGLDRLVGSDGVLPPWTDWWDEAQLAPLFPDAATRSAVEADQPRVPLEYLRGTVPVPDGWTSLPAAYLAFGETYAAERDRAAGWGWPVRTLAGAHLHPVVDPEAVAAAVLGLLAEVGQSGRTAVPVR